VWPRPDNGQTLSNCYVDAIGTLNLVRATHNTQPFQQVCADCVHFQGCGVIANESNYGTALNQRGGGIYATGK
jgi:hypothetical protein